MLYLPRGQDIIIWGCGNVGTKIINNYAQYYNIYCLIDRKISIGKREEYLGYTMYNPNDIINKLPSGIMVVIAMYQWHDAAKKLEEMGLHLFESYITLSQFEYTCINIDHIRTLPKGMVITTYIRKLLKGKKLVATYGFCHMYRYRKVLEDSEQFLNEYIFIDFPALNSVSHINHKFLKQQEIWELCDVVLYSKNPFIEAYDVPKPNQLLNYLKSDCKVITITSAAFKGYFPQHKVLDNNMKENGMRIGWGDKNIDRMLKEGKSLEEITKSILSVDFIKRDKVEMFFQHSLMMLQEDEKHCDIKIADYIKENYKSELLYYSWSHPAVKVLVEIAKRICEKFKITDIDYEKYYEDDLFRMDYSGEELVYPSVCQVLDKGVAAERKIRPGDFYKDKLSSEEYIKEYIYCYERKKKV